MERREEKVLTTAYNVTVREKEKSEREREVHIKMNKIPQNVAAEVQAA